MVLAMTASQQPSTLDVTGKSYLFFWGGGYLISQTSSRNQTRQGLLLMVWIIENTRPAFPEESLVFYRRDVRLSSPPYFPAVASVVSVGAHRRRRHCRPS